MSSFSSSLQCGGLGKVLGILKSSKDPSVVQRARAALGLMGYAGPVGGRGIRLLTIDGGGVK